MGNSVFKPAVLHLKIDLVSHSFYGRDIADRIGLLYNLSLSLSYIYIYIYIYCCGVTEAPHKMDWSEDYIRAVLALAGRK